METLRFEYKPNVWFFAFSGLLFGMCTLVFIHLALSVDTEVPIRHGTQIRPGAEKVMGWGLVMCGAAFVFISLVFIKRAFSPKLYVVLDDHAISAPKGTLTRVIVTVPLSEITKLNVHNIKSTHCLEIRHNRGQLTIVSNMLGKRYNFDKLVETLRERSLGRQA